MPCYWRRVKPRLPRGEAWAAELKHHRVVLTGHLLYMFGGKTSNPHKVYVLDLNSSSWRGISLDEEILPFATYGHTATLLKDSVYLIGGGDSRVLAGDYVHVFDLALEELQLKATSSVDQPGHLISHSAEYIEHRREFVVFKGGGLNSASNVVFSLEPITFNWRQLHPKGKPPRARSAQASCVCNRSMFIFGGESYSAVFNDLYVFTYESTGSSWHQPLIIGDSPGPRFGASLTAIDGKILLFGGRYFMNGSTDLFWFDPKENEWIEELPHKTRRTTIQRREPRRKCYHATVLTPNHRLLVLGGSQEGTSYHELCFEWQ